MQLRQQPNQSQTADKNFQCLGCPMDIMCAFSQCERGNTLFCFNCIQQKHENCSDHKWDQYACQITNWTEMIQDLKEKSYNELENSAVITAYEQLEVMKSTLVNALENMQSKIVEYCPSIKTYARVYSYKPDSDFITNFTLRKSLVFDPAKQSLKFKHPINSENVDFPHILTRKLILQAQDLQRNFSHQCKKFLIDIEEVDPSFQNFRNTLRGASKLAFKDIIKNQRAENYIAENLNQKQQKEQIFAKENQNMLPDTPKIEQQHAEDSASYTLRSRNKGSSMNLRTLKPYSNNINNNNSNSIYNYSRSQSSRNYSQAVENKEITNGTSNLLNRKRRKFYREEKEERKLKILKDALKMGNIMKAAKIHGVSGSVIRKWRKLYSSLPEIQEYNRIYQENRCAQEKYSAAEKKVILMELKLGSVKQSVANKYRIHPTTLRKWEKKFGKELGFKEFADSRNESIREDHEDGYYDVKEEYSDEEAEDGDIDGDDDEDDDEIDIQIEQEDLENEDADVEDDVDILDHQSLVDNKNSNSVQLIKDPNNHIESVSNNRNNNVSSNNENNINNNNKNDNNNNNNNSNNNNQPENAKTQSNNQSIDDKNKDNNSQSYSQEKPQKKQQQQSNEQRMSLRTRRQQTADSSVDTKNSRANQSIDLEGSNNEEDSHESVSQEVPNKELYKPHARFNKNFKIKEEDQSDSNSKRKTRSTVNQHL
ncbi:hypothetical protein TTHERM_00488370 (macronuclear) [Tetrahymena thermophila SB210]|uniref:Uncharacterized protein n=1 Tax=Tetrahymena thermophila (strain SB210) TaxID=312017 RepID=Q23JD7_TETTS|nr:hypothetical protein TTHERM_00488370 [Tetrahymena thermophila SB210]EAR96567.2 hypothetical protein TTHERM_00488370 [Tetrahymena thermophila SB210]|eukprot:XP_001016812.2 hypothetical protein TTHERM_00488370 [Tetrahymena thermophila SB210]